MSGSPTSVLQMPQMHWQWDVYILASCNGRSSAACQVITFVGGRIVLLGIPLEVPFQPLSHISNSHMKQNSCWSAHKWGHACWSQKWLSILGLETTKNICSPSPLVLNHPPNSPHDQQSYHPPSHALYTSTVVFEGDNSHPHTLPIPLEPPTTQPCWQSQPPASLCQILAPLSSKLSAVSATLIGTWHQSLSVLLWLTCCKDSTVIRFSMHESSTVSKAISHSHNPSSLPQWATSWACLRSWRWAIIPLHLLLQSIVHTLLIHCATPPLFPSWFSKPIYIPCQLNHWDSRQSSLVLAHY